MAVNLPLLSIIAYYILSIYPHGHAVILASQGNLGRHDNRNPKASAYTDSLKKRLGAKKFAQWERCESCHRNHLENMPLFVAAVFAGLFASQRAGYDVAGLETFVLGWLVIRVAYTINYITTDTVRLSYARSALYFAGSFWAFAVIAQAAIAVATDTATVTVDEPHKWI